MASAGEPTEVGDEASLKGWLLAPLRRFLGIEAASGVLLLAATGLALAWANSPWSATYPQLWGWVVATRSLHFWINDGLMTCFFFVVGLEVRRELHGGSLSQVRQATLPAFAALGGMLVPALLYLVIAGSAAPRGWAVPIATDIAFAIGVLSLVGSRVPDALRVLLLALAIVDDIGAIIVIALFYSGHLALVGLGVAGASVGIVLLMQRFAIRSAWAYVAPALLMWLGMAHSGVHPTLAGVVLGLLTPARVPAGEPNSPVDRGIERFHPWVTKLLMPLFALANAGVDLHGVSIDEAGTRIALGIVVGLSVGKPLGIWLAVQLARATKLAVATSDITSSGVLLVGMVGGIGFTMAIFLAELAFPDSPQLPLVKAAVVLGSALSAVAGAIYGRVRASAPVWHG